MAYQSYYAGNQTAAPAKPKTGGGYQSFYGNSVQQAPSATELATRRKKRKDEEQVQAKKTEAAKPKSTSLISKVGSVGKELASSAVSSERAVAKGISRIAPGGNSDVDANLKMSNEASKRVEQISKNLKTGKVNKATAQKQLKDETKNTDSAVKSQKSIEKDMPTRGQIAAGAAGTAADIVTAGTLPKLKAGVAGLKVAKTAKVANTAIRVGSNAAAGGLNAAAAGGDKKEVAKNTLLGAAFPEAVGGAVKIASKPVQKVLESQQKINTLIDRARANTALTMARRDREAAATVEAPPASAIQEGVPAKTTTKLPNETDQAFAHRYMAENPERVAKDYADRVKQEFGTTKDNVVSGDEAKFVIPDFAPDKSVPYHEAASTYAKQHYAKLLKDTTTKDRPVMIMAGGSGAGKTSSLREVMSDEGKALDDFAAVVDTNLTDMKGAESRINAARASGRQVDITFVYRDPKESYADGVIPRALRTGRVVTDEIHANTHAGSIETIQTLLKKYKEDPDVDIHIVDNSRGRGSSTVLDENKALDFFKDKGYSKDEIRAGALSALDDAVKNKQLTKEQRDQFISKAKESRPQDSGTIKREPKQADKKQVAADKEHVSRVYERLRADHPNELGDELNYDAVNLKDQAEKAVKLIGEDKQKAYRIATGQEVSKDSTATSVNIALAEKALDEGNTDLYATLIRNRSLAQTRRGQELVSEKASINDNSTSRYVKELIGQRLQNLGKKNTFGISLKKTSPKEAATAAIDREVKKLDMQIRNRKLDPKTALALLDKMECI